MPSTFLWLPIMLSVVAPPSVGMKVNDFALRDYRGAYCKLSDWHDRKLIVLVFLGIDCPVAKLYAPRLVEMAKELDARAVQFVGIDSNSNDSISDIDRFARTQQIPFPILKDVGNVIA